MLYSILALLVLISGGLFLFLFLFVTDEYVNVCFHYFCKFVLIQEFKLNPNAKSFTPSLASLRPPPPLSEAPLYFPANASAVPHMHGLSVGIGVSCLCNLWIYAVSVFHTSFFLLQSILLLLTMLRGKCVFLFVFFIFGQSQSFSSFFFYIFECLNIACFVRNAKYCCCQIL